MRLILSAAIIIPYVLQTSFAFIDPIDRNGTVAEKSFVNVDLTSDDTSIVNFVDSQSTDIPVSFIQHVNRLETKLNIVPNSTQINVRSGRIESLTLSYPILPGDGYKNHLLRTVSADGASASHLNAVEAVHRWMIEYASDLNINDRELFHMGSVRTAVHDDGDMIQLHIPRFFKGVPVVGSRAMATVKRGNLINVGLEDWGSIPIDLSVKPTLTVRDVYNVLALYAERRVARGRDHCEAELQIATLTPQTSRQFGRGYEYVLVWRVCPVFEGQDVEAMEGLVDAQTGKIYSFIDRVHYLRAKGGVYPISNDERNPDGVEQSGWPMPYMYVGDETTDTGGNFFSSGGGTASFDGPYVKIGDRCGSASLSGSGDLDWGASGGTDCKSLSLLYVNFLCFIYVYSQSYCPSSLYLYFKTKSIKGSNPGTGGKGNTHASRTNFYELNKAMEMARSHLPGNTWLQNKLKVNVNIDDNCNAWWYQTINFYRQGGGCGNTGELAGVIVHEW
jgi:hypothetical protein